MRIAASTVMVCAVGIFHSATAAHAVSPPPQYHMIDLGTLGGSISVAEGINESGQVAGDSDNSSGARRGFIYSNGIMTPLGTLGGTGPTFVGGLNDLGEVVGVSYTSGNSRQDAFIYRNGQVSDLGIGSSGSNALAINNSGQITGTAYGLNGEFAYLYRGGVPTYFGAFGGTFSIGRAINASGQIAGDAYLPNFASRAFLSSGGSLVNLGILSAAGVDSVAYGINDAGDAVGTSDVDSVTSSHAFLYHNGTMFDLGSLGGPTTAARDINNLGQIVGSSDVSQNISHAFIYQSSVMYDLNNLLDNPSPGWLVYDARGINDSGLIVANAQFNFGSVHAVLLTPVPEPGTLSLLTVGGLGLIMTRRLSRR